MVAPLMTLYLTAVDIQLRTLERTEQIAIKVTREAKE
jgi:hypothetical protein